MSQSFIRTSDHAIAEIHREKYHSDAEFYRDLWMAKFGVDIRVGMGDSRTSIFSPTFNTKHIGLDWVKAIPVPTQHKETN